jgi:hypothetical protein
MILYELLGRDEYRQEELANDPYKRGNWYNNGNVFRDFWTGYHGKRYTPESLGISPPFPDTFTSIDGLVYRRIEGELDNHQFENPGMQGPRFYTPNITGETFVPFVTEKPQTIDNTGYEISSTWHSLKERGLLQK